MIEEDEMFDSEDMRCLPDYLIPKDWKIHLINRKTNEEQLQVIQNPHRDLHEVLLI